MEGVFAVIILVAGLLFIFTGKLKYPIAILLAPIIIPPLYKYITKGDSAPLYDMAVVLFCIPIIFWGVRKSQKTSIRPR